MAATPANYGAVPAAQPQLIQPESTFNAALPYAVGALGVGVAGGTVSLLSASSSTVLALAGAVIALVGAMGFTAVVICGVMYSGDAQGFRKNIWTVLGITAGQAMAEVLGQIARAVVENVVKGFFERK